MSEGARQLLAHGEKAERFLQGELFQNCSLQRLLHFPVKYLGS